MSTHKPRVQVTLEPSLYNLVRRLAKATGASMSSVIGELLQAVEEPMTRVVGVVEAAQAAKLELTQGTREAISRTADELTVSAEALAAALAQVEAQLALDLAGGTRSGAEPTPGRALPEHGNGSNDPRPVTRGSGFNPPPLKT